jgi:hypothetical protein
MIDKDEYPQTAEIEALGRFERLTRDGVPPPGPSCGSDRREDQR